MAESKKAWEPLRREFEKRGWLATRIENSVGAGTPDVVVNVPRDSLFQGYRDIWIELKHIPLPPHSPDHSISIGLRREQYIWLKEAYRHNRPCLLVARIGEEWFIWSDCLSWELAKKPCRWGILLKNAVIASSPFEVCSYLHYFS